MGVIKILQTNLQRKRISHDMAHLIAVREKIDILLTSEPNKKLMKDSGWITDKDLNVAVYFVNKDVGVSKVEMCKGFIRVQLKAFSLYCCYCSPNIAFSDFKIYVDSLMNTVKTHPGEAIILGDLNVKSPQWGSPTSDIRGEYFVEWLSTMDLLTHNTGDKPTFVRGPSQSYIDVTCSTQGIARNILNWKVLDDESHSDHAFIYFEIKDNIHSRNNKTERQKVLFNNKKFQEEIKERTDILGQQESVTIENVMKAVTVSYKASCTGRNKTKNTFVPYWWSVDIETKRRECIAIRRSLTRRRARNILYDASILQLNEEYKRERKELKILINRAKKQHWMDLCTELNENVWGNGYKIATKHLKNQSLPYQLSEERRIEIVEHLFPTKQDSWERGNIAVVSDEFTLEELAAATERLKGGRAPGPDGVPPEAIKELSRTVPEFLLKILNNLLRLQSFPLNWKLAKVILLRKNGKPMDDISAFRPICLLDTCGKLYEILIRERLEKEIEDKGGLSNYQFGFRRGKSTVQAVEAVLEWAKQSKEKWCILITLDIKNAFNTATWSYIIKEMYRRRISQYLINIIEDYFSNRRLKISTSERTMTVGVPQGSVLGPTLWNILYDGILREDLGPGARSICFADDLAVLIEEKDEHLLTLKTRVIFQKLDNWLRQNDLQLAPGKTEALVLKGKRNTDNIKLEFKGIEILPSESINHLGITIGSHVNYRAHINKTVKKAEERITSMSQLMPNIGGPRSQKRAVLSGVVHSILLYAAPIWHSILNTQLYRNKMEQVQRKVLLRVGSAYRTTSTKALQVVTGIIPIEMQVEERRYIYYSQGADTPSKKNIARQRTMEAWQRSWEENNVKGQWTKRLIPDIRRWVECKHRNVEYYLTQVLTGHGSFQTYLKRFGFTEDDSCIYCGQTDTVEHAIFNCIRWHKQRQELNITLELILTADNLISTMVENKRNWRQIHATIIKIMKMKERDRNERQRQNRF